MNKAIFSLTVSLILLAAVIVTTPITIMENAFAKSGTGRHTGGSVGQATSISNSCLNPESNSNTNYNMISNGNCGGTMSQQGKSGQASTPTTVQSANPSIEVQRSTPITQPPTTPNPDVNAGPLDTNIVHLAIIPSANLPSSTVTNVTITDTATQKSNSYITFGSGVGGEVTDIFVIPIGDKIQVTANIIGGNPQVTSDPTSDIACTSTGPTCVGTMINSNPSLSLDVGQVS